MSKTEEKILNEIINLIRVNLQKLIKKNDTCLYSFKNYCKDIVNDNYQISEAYLKVLIEDSLYALLNDDFLYNDIPVLK